MKILIAGSHGMVGSAVTRHLMENGYEVVRLVRQEAGPREVYWNPDSAEIDSASMEGFDGVIHLASMPWPMRWTEKTKQAMRANRLMTNRLLAKSLAGCVHKPRVLICASGIGYYAPSGDDVLTEYCPAGKSFLSILDRDAEMVTEPASLAGIRVVHLRMPTVLGGERLQMLGFQSGDRQQWMSWIGRDELAYIIEFVLHTGALSGPVNAVSPNPMRLTDFARIAAAALGQKPGCAMPSFLVRLVLGEMGEEFLLASRRVQPAKLLAAGYSFQFPDLERTVLHEKSTLNTITELQPAYVTKPQPPHRGHVSNTDSVNSASGFSTHDLSRTK